MSSMSKAALTSDDFVRRCRSISNYNDSQSLLTDALSTENLYRELFARHRDSWVVPEVSDDPYLFTVDVFGNRDVFQCLPRYEDDVAPRCFDLGGSVSSSEEEKDGGGGERLSSGRPRRRPPGSDAVVTDVKEFELNWDCFTEGLLRFLNWDNVVAAGGAVAGCLAPLPTEVSSGGISATRVKRRKYFHDTAYPGSDVDLFLYGLSETEAEKKLLEIYDAVQAANPYEVRAFRSAHAVTLVSQYPFRHVQVVLRLYSGPSEVLMGFDVDACAVGYDGTKVIACPRAVMSLRNQANTIDMTRRSPSYEMRLAKYAERGFEVVVPSLDRDRVDPFLYEKRFDQAKGLARLLLLERLRTPEERLKYRIEGQLKRGAKGNEWRLRAKLHRMTRDKRNLDRREGSEGVVVAMGATGAELSDYSTIFLPWGPEWTASRIERQTKKKDKILNKIEFTPDGRVVKCRRPYKIHVCAVGTMEEILINPFPDDPPIPDDVPPETLESTVRGPITWLLDNPGRQQIGSFHPITTNDWTDGAYVSRATEALIAAAARNDVDAIARELDSSSGGGLDDDVEGATALLATRDFLGRSALHVATLGNSVDAAKALLDHPGCDVELLKARLADGRNVLHLAAMHGFVDILNLVLEKSRTLVAAAKEGGGDDPSEEEGLDVDGADWEAKLSPLQYATAFGRPEIVRALLSSTGGADARKIAVHKDRNESSSILNLLVLHVSESGDVNGTTRSILEQLLQAGASFGQVDTSGRTCWHLLAESPALVGALDMFLKLDGERYKDDDEEGRRKRRATLDVLDNQMRTALYIATLYDNHEAVALLLGAGCTPSFSEEGWADRVRLASEGGAGGGGGRIRQVARLPRHYGFGARGGNNQQENLRNPISLAADNANVPCLEAFLKHDPSFANATIEIPAPMNPNQQPGFGGVYGGGNRGGAAQQTVKATPLDLLEILRSSVQAPNLNRTANNNRNMMQINEAKVRAEYAEKQRDGHEPGSYLHRLWSLLACREREAVDGAEANAEVYEETEEDEKDEADAMGRIEDAVKVLKEAGGTRLVPDQPPPQQQPEPQLGAMIGMTPPASAAAAEPSPPPPLPDPLLEYSELQPVDFAMEAFNPGWERNVVRLVKRDQGRAVDLMVSVSSLPSSSSSSAGEAAGGGGSTFDVAASRVKLNEASARVRVCIRDRMGSTPLFLATAFGSVDLIRAVYEAASAQYQRYVEARNKEKEEEDATEKEKTEEGGEIGDQLRRLNNLDIASGERPRDSGPTPDMMRKRLEEAEAAALRQPVAEEEEGGGVVAEIASPAFPEVLLLHRSVVLAESEPRLAALRERLSKVQPGSFPERLPEAVKLRPIELAVVRGDVGMVRALLGLITAGGGADEGDGNEKEEDEEEEDDEDEDYEEDYDEDYDDDEGMFGATSSTQKEDEIRPLTTSQLRWLLLGEGSRNQDLCGMTLTELAIATDDVPTFLEVVSFAAEHVLPRGAVASWKRQADKEEEEEEGSNIDDLAKAQRKRITDGIEGSSSGYGRRLPLWGAGGAHNVPIHPTVLQFALSVKSDNISRTVLAGEADAALLGWIEAGTVPTALPRQRRGGRDVDSGAIDAAGWLVPLVKAAGGAGDKEGKEAATKMSSTGIGRTDLAYRLVHSTAVDGAGRTALFYCPPDLVKEVLDSGTTAAASVAWVTADTSSAFLVAEDDARSALLESATTVESGGPFTALMASAGAGDVDKVRSLLEAGCKRSSSVGVRHWGAMHAAIPPKDAPRMNRMHGLFAGNNDDVTEGDNAESERWAKTREIIRLLLDNASDEELDTMLLCPEAEHTPLMLAAQRGADGETMSLLIKHTKRRAAAKGEDAFARRDGELNSALHIAVEASLKGKSAPGGHGPHGSMDGITALLDGGGTNLPSSAGGPNAENARGATPVELSLEAMASVWGRGGTLAGSSEQRRVQAEKNRVQRRRQELGRNPLPPPPLPEGLGQPIEPSTVRRVHTILDGAANTDRRGHRVPVRMDEVQEAKERILAGKGSTGAAEVVPGGGGSELVEPTGPPVVLAAGQYGHYNRFGHSGYRTKGKKTRRVQWNGWPQQ